MNNEKNTNTFGATLNMRGKMRRAGVRTADYLKVNGKQNMIIIGATIFLFIIFTHDMCPFIFIKATRNQNTDKPMEV